MLKVRVDCDRLCPGRTGQTTLTQCYLCKMTQKLKQQRGQTVTMPKVAWWRRKKGKENSKGYFMHGVITHEFTFFPKPNCDSSCFPIVCAVCWYRLDTVVTTPLYLFRLKKKKKTTNQKNKKQKKTKTKQLDCLDCQTAIWKEHKRMLVACLLVFHSAWKPASTVVCIVFFQLCNWVMSLNSDHGFTDISKETFYELYSQHTCIFSYRNAHTHTLIYIYI